jgi:hypothetical protein
LPLSPSGVSFAAAVAKADFIVAISLADVVVLSCFTAAHTSTVLPPPAATASAAVGETPPELGPADAEGSFPSAQAVPVIRMTAAPVATMNARITNSPKRK